MPKTNAREIRHILLQYDGLIESGKTHKEIAEKFDVTPAALKSWRKQEHVYLSTGTGAWRKPHQGKTWEDMPGSDYVTQRCNFSLFRRGWLVYNADGKLVPLKYANAARKGGRKRKPNSKTKPEPDDADMFIFAETEDPSTP